MNTLRLKDKLLNCVDYLVDFLAPGLDTGDDAVPLCKISYSSQSSDVESEKSKSEPTNFILDDDVPYFQVDFGDGQYRFAHLIKAVVLL